MSSTYSWRAKLLVPELAVFEKTVVNPAKREPVNLDRSKILAGSKRRQETLRTGIVVKEESGKYKDNQILDCVLVPTFDQVRRRRKRESTFDPVKLEDGQPHGLFNNINEHNASLLSHERVSQKTLSRSDGVVKVEQRMASSSTHSKHIKAKSEALNTKVTNTLVKAEITLQSEEGNGNGSALSNHVPRVQYTTNAQKHSSVLVPQTILQLDHSVSLKGQGRPAVRVKELSPEIILSFDEEDYKTIEAGRKPIENIKAKAKKEEMTLTPDILISRFKDAGYSMEPFKVSIEDEVRDVAVSRDKFISRIYGGSPIRVFPTISQKMLKKHGLNDFMFLCGDIQSRAPEMPGHVGLWYSCGYDYFDAPMRVITRVQDKPARWQYQGQYHVEYSKPLTREEWSMQPVKVRNAWSQALYEERWGCEIRGIVYAYKMYGREPTEKEVDLICAQGLCKKATPEDISLGMARGDVTISVFIMKCVGYDEKFQRELAERWDGGQGIFKPTGSSTRKKGTKRTRSSEKAPIQRKKGRFAADLRHETEEESDLPTSDEDEEDDEGGDDNGLYSTRGTRSNPIALG